MGWAHFFQRHTTRFHCRLQVTGGENPAKIFELGNRDATQPYYGFDLTPPASGTIINYAKCRVGINWSFQSDSTTTDASTISSLGYSLIFASRGNNYLQPSMMLADDDDDDNNKGSEGSTNNTNKDDKNTENNEDKQDTNVAGTNTNDTTRRADLSNSTVGNGSDKDGSGPTDDGTSTGSDDQKNDSRIKGDNRDSGGSDAADGSDSTKPVPSFSTRDQSSNNSTTVAPTTTSYRGDQASASGTSPTSNSGSLGPEGQGPTGGTGDQPSTTNTNSPWDFQSSQNPATTAIQCTSPFGLSTVKCTSNSNGTCSVQCMSPAGNLSYTSHPGEVVTCTVGTTKDAATGNDVPCAQITVSPSGKSPSEISVSRTVTLDAQGNQIFQESKTTNGSVQGATITKDPNGNPLVTPFVDTSRSTPLIDLRPDELQPPRPDTSTSQLGQGMQFSPANSIGSPTPEKQAEPQGAETPIATAPPEKSGTTTVTQTQTPNQNTTTIQQRDSSKPENTPSLSPEKAPSPDQSTERGFPNNRQPRGQSSTTPSLDSGGQAQNVPSKIGVASYEVGFIIGGAPIPIFGPFLSGGVAVGATTTGQVFLQFRGSPMVGPGIAGAITQGRNYGFISTPMKVGRDEQWYGRVEANLAIIGGFTGAWDFDRSSFGGSIPMLPTPKMAKYGAEEGAAISLTAGVTGVITFASPSLPPIRSINDLVEKFSVLSGRPKE